MSNFQFNPISPSQIAKCSDLVLEALPDDALVIPLTGVKDAKCHKQQHVSRQLKKRSHNVRQFVRLLESFVTKVQKTNATTAQRSAIRSLRRVIKRLKKKGTADFVAVARFTKYFSSYSMVASLRPALAYGGKFRIASGDHFLAFHKSPVFLPTDRVHAAR